jgi:hypothetical protein
VAIDRTHLDVDRYACEGWLHVPGFVPAQTVDALQHATDRLEARAAGFTHDTAVHGVFFEMQSESGRKREPAVVPGALRKITGPSKGEPAFMKLRRDARLLSRLAQLGVPAPRCVVDQVNFKHPRFGTGFPWHQDANFLHGDADRDLRAFGGVNLVIALDPTDADNGGFAVLGRTHTSPVRDLQDHYDTSTRNTGLFDESHLVVPSLQPGDAVLFHPHLAHGSGPNLSERRRRLVTMWFVGTGVVPPLHER